MDPNKIRKLPALQEYLHSQPMETPSPKPDLRKSFIAGLIAFGVVGVLTSGFGLAACLVSATAAGLTIGLTPYLGAQSAAIRQPKFEGLLSIKSRLREICRRKRVHREMDAGAAIALESCARSYLRIRETLLSAAWNPDRLDENWEAMRRDALERAEDAMDEAIFLCRSWIGQKRSARRTNWKGALGDLLEGDFDDVLERFTESDDDEDRDFARHSSFRRSTGFALQPVREIGQNLKRLAQELEGATTLIGSASSSADSSPAPSDLEKTLQNLRELKQAESELNESVQMRLNG